MKSKSMFALIIVVLLVIPLSAYSDQGQDFIEHGDKGVINWSKGTVQATGIRLLQKNCTANRVPARWL